MKLTLIKNLKKKLKENLIMSLKVMSLFNQLGKKKLKERIMKQKILKLKMSHGIKI